MGRFSVETSINNPAVQNQANNSNIAWPAVFPKETIGIDRNGVIVQHDEPIYNADQITIVPGSLDAIRMMRLKGYNVYIFFNEPMIGEGKTTPEAVDLTNNKLMEIFGRAGIMSINGLLYSTTDSKQDIFSLPNTGMLKKAEKELKAKFKGGYFVGDKLYDIKAGDSAGAKPVLIRTNKYDEVISKLDTFANRELKKRVRIYNTLLDFAEDLP